MPKVKNIITGEYITAGVLPEQKKVLEKEAEEQGISLAQLIRNKLFNTNKKHLTN